MWIRQFGAHVAHLCVPEQVLCRVCSRLNSLQPFGLGSANPFRIPLHVRAALSTFPSRRPLHMTRLFTSQLGSPLVCLLSHPAFTSCFGIFWCSHKFAQLCSILGKCLGVQRRPQDAAAPCAALSLPCAVGILLHRTCFHLVGEAIIPPICHAHC